MVRWRFVFAGSGGQGVVTAAIIMGEAAVIYEGLNAVQSQSYGAAVRGGISRSDLIISDSEIDFPKVTQPNVLVCLSQTAYNELYRIIRPGGLLITDNHYVKTHRQPDARLKNLPFYHYVKSEIGDLTVLNICMLGAIQVHTGIIHKDCILKVLQKKGPLEYIDMNQKAFQLGRELAL